MLVFKFKGLKEILFLPKIVFLMENYIPCEQKFFKLKGLKEILFLPKIVFLMENYIPLFSS
ncbi:MAG: hypothetical protein DRQ49_04460 [Gammaproteobacteria bacterium]|nr:MAG: hypothetical protein DRQ49_04460 [Gammaproteobacteria bacterium]